MGALIRVAATLMAASTICTAPAFAVTFTSLGSFSGAGPGTNGGGARGPLYLDSGGNILGLANSGGPGRRGTVFQVNAGSTGITNIANFDFTATGGNPYGGLIADSLGNLYGTTEVGGGAGGQGTVFRINAGTSTITRLATFTGGNGANPRSTLVIDPSGNLYGTTYAGGANGLGTVFRIDAGTTTINTLASFSSSTGANPYAGLYRDAVGNLFGTTIFGGTSGNGTVFRISAGSSTITTLANLTFATGINPHGQLVADANGNLYGTTQNFGGGSGTVFRIDAITQAFTTITALTNPSGRFTYSGVIVDAAGNLFGTTAMGGSTGAAGRGTVFRIDAGSSSLTTLHEFTATATGLSPYGGLVADASGSLFGTTIGGGTRGGFGTVFRLDDVGYVTRLPAAVPEPTTWSLMILGFGAAGIALRRRRRPYLA